MKDKTLFIYLFIYLLLFIHLFNNGKVRHTIPVYRIKNKMLIKADGAIKPIMNENVKTNK